MNKKIKNITQDIRNGKLLEENIPQLFNQLANHYQTNAGVRLAMHYYAFYEAFCEEEDIWSKEVKEAISRLNKIIQENILQSQSGLNREEAVRIVDEMRNDIMKRMNLLTAYTDIFQTYEYVLNRIEYRFIEDQNSVDGEEFTKEVLRYIFETQDNMVINEKIKEMIGQLPIRITKQKYFDLLKESIWAYLGADQSSLDTYLYMMRTSAMIYNEDGMDTYYPKLWENKKLLSQLQYKDITRNSYEMAVNTLRAATLTLETEASVYFSLQEIVNEVYAILLCSTYSGMVVSETKAAEEAAFSIIQEINDIFVTNEKKDLPMNLLEKFSDIEGIQEEMSFDFVIMEDALYELDKNHGAFTKSLMLDPFLRVLLRSQKLLSNSLFINLEGEEEEEIVDEDRIEKEVKSLEDELTTLFAEHDRVICRAVMANTLNKMPVFFKDHTEVMEYVRYSFERCSDSYEKSACVEIINAIMSE